MKRLLALVIALLLCALPALAELWYTDDILPDGSPIYYFEELSITLPASWAGKVMAQEEASGTAFYHKASHEKYAAEGIEGGGLLFRLGASVNGSFSQLPAFRYLGFSESSAMNYYLELPSDYPAYAGDAAVRAEYDALYADIDAVVSGVSFYAGNAADAEPTKAPAKPAPAAPAADTSRAAQVRRHFEQSALPRYFYEEPETMLEVLRANGVYRLWMSLAVENGAGDAFTEEDFGERWYDLAGGATLLQVEMPRPVATPDCYRVYLAYDPAAGKAGYYTVEYDNLLGETAFLCGRDAEGTHINYGGAAALNPGDAGYEEALAAEAGQVAKLAGLPEPGSAGSDGAPAPEDDANLARIECPELGFSTLADPALSWKYEEGTGIYIYTEEAGRIPYVIVFRSEDLLGEPLEYIQEQYTPHMRKQYGANLISAEEIADLEVGGRQLPAGKYSYNLQGHTIEMLRIYDSTGPSTVAFTAKYEASSKDATLRALDAAVRGFRFQ